MPGTTPGRAPGTSPADVPARPRAVGPKNRGIVGTDPVVALSLEDEGGPDGLSAQHPNAETALDLNHDA